jgi:hypothetical protein
MASAITIKRNISKLEAALKSKATPKTLKSKLEAQLVKSKSELSDLSKGTKPKTSTTKSTQSTLQKLKEMVNKNKKYSTYKGAGVDLEKDADRPALRIGKRTAKKSGKTYYEYRANRIDVKQPPKKYPKLEDGGMMAKGGVSSYGTREIPYVVVDTDEITVLREFKNYNSAIKFMDEYLENNSDKMGSLYAMPKESWDKESQKYMKKGGMMAHGGMTEHEIVESNAEMIISKIKEVKHHAKELSELVSKDSEIEAWVVAKIERASTDLSDITHYLDGRDDEEIEEDKYEGYMKHGGYMAKVGEMTEELYKVVGKKNGQLVDISELPMSKDDANKFIKEQGIEKYYTNVDVIRYRGNKPRHMMAHGGEIHRNEQ